MAFDDPGEVTEDALPPMEAGGTGKPVRAVPLSNGSGLTGNYSDRDINGLLSGRAWHGNTLTYSFPTSSSVYGGSYSDQAALSGFQAVSEAQKTAVRYALDLISQYTGLGFTEITETANTHAHLRFANSSNSAQVPTSYAYLPGTYEAAGDVWFGNIRNDATNPGYYAFDSILHEIGHALGLKHGQDPYQESGGPFFPTLPASHDNSQYSLMDYHSYPNGPLAYTNQVGSGNMTYMVDDIAALQFIYGSNGSTNSGNTVYTWSTTTGAMSINGVAQLASTTNTIYRALWDAGGIDTYDLSNYSTNLVLNLNPGEWSTFSTAQLARLDVYNSATLAAGNVANALLNNGNISSLIENAVGGTGNDTITGNAANNTLTGNEGNDTLDGAGGTDIAVYRGTYAQYTLAKLSANSWRIVDTVSSRDGTDTVSNVETLQFSDRNFSTANAAPVVTTANITRPRNTTLAVSSLFTVTDAENDTITKYQVWDGNADANSGHFVLNGSALGSGTTEITAGQLSQLDFVTGTVGDNLEIRAFDGWSWSADGVAWAPFRIDIPANRPPLVTTANLSKKAGQTLAGSSLFTVSDADGDTITKYQVWDGNSDPNSGHFVLNGSALGAGTTEITAGQLSQLSFVTGTVGDNLEIRAFDGRIWSADGVAWAPFRIDIQANRGPVVTTANISAARNQTIAGSSLFSASDPDGDTITKYQVWDGNADAASGHFVLNGSALGAGATEITATQLSQLSFVTGTVGDNLEIRAWDGNLWSADGVAWAPFRIDPPVNHPPVVTTANLTRKVGQTLDGASLFTVSDADGDTITRYQVWDGNSDPNSGHFVLNGSALGAGTTEITPGQLSQLSFVTGTVGDNIEIRAWDGTAWSADGVAWAPFRIDTGPNRAPVVTTSNLTRPAGQTMAGSGLFTVSDADGDTITKYQVWDGNADASSGHFVLNGSALGPGTTEITAGQLSQLSFVTGTVGDNLEIRASDGDAWSADGVAWAPFRIDIGPNHAPVVTTANLTKPAGQTLAASSLFSVSDADGDTITKYQVWDGNADPNSGHFVLNGSALAPGTTEITAGQLSQLSFLTGSVGDNLEVRAFDGRVWSADGVAWAPFHIAIG